MLSCKQLVAHSSEFLDGQLGLRKRMSVRLHLAMCEHCRRFIKQMRLSQAVLRQRSDQSSLAALEWAFVALRPTPDWTLRLGRINPDAFLLSDYRNVGFAYPWVRPEIGFYGTIPLYSITGGDLTRTWADGSTYWKAKLFAGNGSITV